MRRGYDISGAAANHQSGMLIPLGSDRNCPSAEAGVPALPVVTKVRFYRYR